MKEVSRLPTDGTELDEVVQRMCARDELADIDRA